MDDQEANAPASGALAAAAQAAPAAEQPTDQVDPQTLDLVNLVVGRSMQALTETAQDMDMALKSDPVQGAVQFGTGALRTVAQAAEQAGKPLPFNILAMSGMVLLQAIAAIAMEKGYLDEADLDSFLKEGFQQSIQAYAKMDLDDGVMDPAEAEKVAQMSGAKPPQAGPQDGAEPGPQDGPPQPAGALSAAAQPKKGA